MGHGSSELAEVRWAQINKDLYFYLCESDFGELSRAVPHPWLALYSVQMFVAILPKPQALRLFSAAPFFSVRSSAASRIDNVNSRCCWQMPDAPAGWGE